MTTVKVSSKGQITLPAGFRHQAGITAGTRLQACQQGNTLVLKPAPDFFAFKGCLGKAKPLAEERQDAETAAAERAGGGKAS